MKKYLSAILVVIMLIGIIIPVSTVQAANSTYYVDSSGGDDSNSGTSEAIAWKSLDKVNSMVFQPGDKILFKAGGSWVGTLKPMGSGDSTAQITVDMYGTGNKPHIEGNGALSAVEINGLEYWTVRNLEVTNNASDVQKRQGIYVVAKTEGITHRIYIQDCEIHDVDGDNRRNYDMYNNAAIYITYPGRSTAANHFDEVVIERNNVHDVMTCGIKTTQESDYPYADKYFTNVIVRNNVVNRVGSDGMIISHVTNPLIEYNACLDAGYYGTYSDTILIAGIWSTAAYNATWQYNEVARTRLFQGDGTAFDTDWGASGTHIYQYNYTHGNEGGFFLNCAGLLAQPDYSKSVCRYNVSVDDKQAVIRPCNANKAVDLYNNVFYKSQGYLELGLGGPTDSTISFRNNIFNFQSSPPNWGSGQYSYNCYYPISKNPADLKGVTADPQFVNAGAVGDGMAYADNYKLKASSPCINAGMNITDNGGKDFWGNSLYTGTPDIGAFEYNSDLPEQNVYSLASGFSSVQGKNQWYYMESNGAAYTEMVWQPGSNQWKGSYQYNLIWSPSQIHPDTNDSVVAWKAPRAGTVRVTGNVRKRNSGYDGVNVKILQNNTQKWPASGWQFIAGNDTAGLNQDFTATVAQGDMLYFVVNKNVNNYSDETSWDPTVEYVQSAFSDNFEDGNSTGWSTHGGNWSVTNNGGATSYEYRLTSAGPGYKSFADGTYFSDFTYEADVLTGTSGDAGLIFRGSNPGMGADSYNGYYAGISNQGYVLLGKASGTWTLLGTANMTVSSNTWYHIKVIAVGSNIKVFVGDMSTPKLELTDSTYSGGAVGVRAYNSAAGLDNINVVSN